MTPEQKAMELVDKYRNIIMSFLSDRMKKENAKKCALIAVDGILESQPRYPSEVDWDDVGGTHEYFYQAQREEAEKFWKEVKQELNKL